MTEVPCRGCGKPITWATDAQGQRIPLDPRAPVYAVRVRPDGSIEALRDMRYAVSHFSTCTAANKFSGAGQAKGSGAQSEQTKMEGL